MTTCVKLDKPERDTLIYLLAKLAVMTGANGMKIRQQIADVLTNIDNRLIDNILDN